MRELAHAPRPRPIPGRLIRLLTIKAIAARPVFRSASPGTRAFGRLVTQLIGFVLCIIHGPLLIAAIGDPARFFAIGLSLLAFAAIALLPRVPRSVVWSLLLGGAVVHHGAMTSIKLESEVTAAIATGGVLAAAGARRRGRRRGTRRRPAKNVIETFIERIRAALDALHAAAGRIIGWRSRIQMRPNAEPLSPALTLLMIARGPPAPARPF